MLKQSISAWILFFLFPCVYLPGYPLIKCKGVCVNICICRQWQSRFSSLSVVQYYIFFSKKKSETNALLLICVRVFVKLTRPVFFSQYICALLISCKQFLWNKLTQYYFNNKFMMKMIGHTSILHQHIVQSMMHLIT